MGAFEYQAPGIHFNPNGGTGVMMEQPITGASIAALSSCTLTRTGYTFAGWSTSPKGEIAYADGAPINGLPTDSGAIFVLYAQWTASKYAVRFDANDGGGTMVDQTFVYDTSQTLAANKFTRTGYAFAGWATSKDDEVAYADGAGVANLVSSGAVTLYARWTRLGAKAYAISFNAKGGTKAMEPQICVVGRIYKLPKCGFAKPEGKTRFAGWSGADGRRYDDEMLVFDLAKPGETVTMTAIWE